jgi:hypothetical protein
LLTLQCDFAPSRPPRRRGVSLPRRWRGGHSLLDKRYPAGSVQRNRADRNHNCHRSRRSWPGCEGVVSVGVLSAPPNRFILRVIQYGLAEKRLADRAIRFIERKKIAAVPFAGGLTPGAEAPSIDVPYTWSDRRLSGSPAWPHYAGFHIPHSRRQLARHESGGMIAGTVCVRPGWLIGRGLNSTWPTSRQRSRKRIPVSVRGSAAFSALGLWSQNSRSWRGSD